MKPKNETEVVEYTRAKEVTDPNSLVLDFDGDGNVDVEAMRDERETRNVPPDPPPPAAQPRWLDGKCIAQIAVSECINCRSWHFQAVMRFLIDSANRKNGACYPIISAGCHSSPSPEISTSGSGLGGMRLRL